MDIIKLKNIDKKIKDFDDLRKELLKKTCLSLLLFTENKDKNI